MRTPGAGRPAALFRASVATGLVAGTAFGWAQAIALAWPARELLGAAEWADVLGYAGLAHALVWVATGAVSGALCALGLALVPGLRARTAPGAVALALFGASTSSFLLWSAAAFLGVGLAEGIQRPWVVLVAVWWCLAFTTLCTLAHPLARGLTGRAAAALLRLARIPVALLLAASALWQWWEAPRLAEPAAAPPAAARAAGGAAQPHVALIVVDTQRVDRLGAYGYARPTTPRLDAFAADAHVFEHGISGSIWTLPSHASMFTGLFESEHWTHYDHRWLDDELTTLAELLRERGYETVAFSNNTWVSPVSNLMQGFDRFVRPAVIHHARGNSISEFVDKVLYPAGRVGTWLGALTAEDSGARYTASLIERWLRTRDAARPFFLFVNITEPHAPYRPHLPHRRLFVEPEAIDASYRNNWDRVKEFSLLKRDVYDAAALALLNATYDGETRLADDYVGRMLDALAAAVPLDDTLVIVTSDHGENLGDHHLIEHRYCVYDTLVHVPLVVRFPSRLAPGRSSDLVQNVDLLPTVLDAVDGGAPAEPAVSGRSLLPPLGETVRPGPEDAAPGGGPLGELVGRVAVSERLADGTGEPGDVRFDLSPYRGVMRAIRQGPWKYIRYGDGREELFRVADDPGETRNLLDQHRDVADALAGRLGEWLAQRRPYEAPEAAGEAIEMDPATRARLRALGYLP